MREIRKEIDAVKQKVGLLKGQQIYFVVNKGRNKFVRFGGCVQDVYPSIFTVKSDEAGVQSFSYNDILTKNIKFCRHAEK